MNNIKVFDNKQFEGQKVEIIMLDGEPLFELYSTGMALGYVVIAKGKKYPRKERIDQNVKNTDIDVVFHNGQQYLTEDMLYDFMLESRTEKCKKFRKWVTKEVIPDIRKNGMYATESTIDNMLNNPDFAITLLTKYKEEKEERKKLQEENKKKDGYIIELGKKTSMLDDFLTKDNLYSIDSVSKILAIKGLGRNNFYKYLRENKIIQADTYTDYKGREKSGAKHFTAYAKYTNVQQYFKHRNRELRVGTNVVQQNYSMFTPKGIEWIYKRLQNDGYIIKKDLDMIIEELNIA